MKRYYWRPHDDCGDVELLGDFEGDQDVAAYLFNSGAPAGVRFRFTVYLDGSLAEAVCLGGRVH